MTRTRHRATAANRIPLQHVLIFGLGLSMMSVLLIGFGANWVAAGLALAGNLYYVLIYTKWLKRRTPQNIVIGGAAGAFPPMIGWASVTGSVGLESIVLFALIFMWTPPHFWALALYRWRDYERAGIPMLPVVAGLDETRRQILVYSVLLAPLALVPAFIGLGGIVYLIAATLLGCTLLALALRVYRTREGRAADRAAKQMFGFSILYLFLLFAVVLFEHAGRLLSG
jgi:protoheme IX farnesyltransferase